VPVANPAGLNQHWFGTQMGRFGNGEPRQGNLLVP
jgi:hypothetical protein